MVTSILLLLLPPLAFGPRAGYENIFGFDRYGFWKHSKKRTKRGRPELSKFDTNFSNRSWEEDVAEDFDFAAHARASRVSTNNNNNNNFIRDRKEIERKFTRRILLIAK